MNATHAAAFCLLGTGMILLPVAMPGWFPPDGIDGANTSALWLQLMGWVHGTLGAGHVTRREVVPFIVRVRAWRPALPSAKLLRRVA